MLQQELNNESFRSRLAAPETLPGEYLQDKDAAWDKLQNRLNQKPKRAAAAWYYWAAAVLVACLSLPFLIKEQPKKDVVKAKLPTKVSPQHLIPSPAASPETVMTIIQQNDVASKTGLSLNKPAQLKKITENKKVVTDQNTIQIPEDIVAQKEIIAQQTVTENTEAVATIPEKKALRVVNINELEANEREAMATTAMAKNLLKTPRASRARKIRPTEYAGILHIKIPLKQ